LEIQFVLAAVGMLGQYVEYFQSMIEIPNRFDMGGALMSTLSCSMPVTDSLFRQTGFRVVMGEQFGLCLSGLRKLGFQDLSDPLVMLLSRTL
jgi:hypothetical protein